MVFRIFKTLVAGFVGAFRAVFCPWDERYTEARGLIAWSYWIVSVLFVVVASKDESIGIGLLLCYYAFLFLYFFIYDAFYKPKKPFVNRCRTEFSIVKNFLFLYAEARTIGLIDRKRDDAPLFDFVPLFMLFAFPVMFLKHLGNIFLVDLFAFSLYVLFNLFRIYYVAEKIRNGSWCVSLNDVNKSTKRKIYLQTGFLVFVFVAVLASHVVFYDTQTGWLNYG